MKYYFIALICALGLCSCSEGTPNQLLDQAEAAVSDGDFNEARICCKALSDSTRYTLTPSQLCREAIIYAHISEWGDNPDDMAAATRCYDKALAESPDSVEAFAATLDVENLATLNMIHNVRQALGAPTEMLHDEFEDQEDTPTELPNEPKPL
ncbi:MAG: hypothetical protein LIP03_08695 [Bacteroidales bacterium]|nr:hypothetical protein [Bacteroidales bacterium]